MAGRTEEERTPRLVGVALGRGGGGFLGGGGWRGRLGWQAAEEAVLRLGGRDRGGSGRGSGCRVGGGMGEGWHTLIFLPLAMELGMQPDFRGTCIMSASTNLILVEPPMSRRKLVHGAGEMAELIRRWNWEATPLGALEAWPEELLAIVNMVLSSPIAMAIYWGPEQVLLYNDAYRPITAARHPGSLGRSGGQVWAEAWHIIGPQVDRAFAGQTACATDCLVPIEVEGAMQDRYWTYSLSPIHCGGRIQGVFNVCLETTQNVLANLRMKRSEASLRESEERFRALFAMAPMGVVMSDLDTERILVTNEEMARITGYSQGEMAAMPTRAFTHPEDRGGIEALYGRVRDAEGTTVLEKRYLRKEGDTVWVRVSLRKVHLPGQAGPHVLAMVQNISEARRTEAALLQAEKLAVVGRLAASIAHEINNPLEAVTNLIYLAKGSEERAVAREYLDAAEVELARVGAIATQTLRFHRQSTKARAVRWEDLIESVLAIFQGRIWNQQVRVERRDRAARELICFEGEIRQVLSNLVGNVVDAAPREGGRMLLRSREGTDWRTGRRGLVVTVADNGCGMSEETQKKIFEAFYTTKGNNGTGLGLWVSCEIVGRHGGRLTVRSRQGEGRSGAVFCLFLPFEAVVYVAA